MRDWFGGLIFGILRYDKLLLFLSFYKNTYFVICNTYLVLENTNIQSIFIVKEASEEQVKSLVVDSKQGKITEEDLEELISKQSISKNQAKLKGRREKLLPLIFLFLARSVYHWRRKPMPLVQV